MVERFPGEVVQGCCAGQYWASTIESFFGAAIQQGFIDSWIARASTGLEAVSRQPGRSPIILISSLEPQDRDDLASAARLVSRHQLVMVASMRQQVLTDTPPAYMHSTLINEYMAPSAAGFSKSVDANQR